MSLYPYICMYFKFPIGHPVVHVRDTCKDIRAYLQMDGLTKYTIVPPIDLYHHVLPFRYNKKLLFCLCRTCAFEQNMRAPYEHLSDAERAISGTWVLDELRMAVPRVTELWRFTKCMNMQCGYRRGRTVCIVNRHVSKTQRRG